MSEATVIDGPNKVYVDAVLFEIGKLELKPSDVLVIAAPEGWTPMQATYFSEAARRVLDDYGVKNHLAVYPGGVKLGVLSMKPEPWWRRIFKR